MNKMLMAMMLVLTMSATLAADKPLTLSKDAVGVIYLEKETPQNYRLKVLIPESFIAGIEGDRYLNKNDKVILPEKLNLFDDKGVLGQITTPASASLEFYCENDGGDHFRPSFVITVAKSTLSRPLKGHKKADGIAAFVSEQTTLERVISNDENETREGQSSIEEDSGYFVKTLIKGKTTATAPFSAIVIEESSEAGCGDDLEDNGLYLRASGKEGALRCCGP